MNISGKDFAEALEFLGELERGPQSTLAKALLTAFVVAYARPFSKNKTGGKSTPTLPGSSLRTLSAAEMKLHGKLLAIRNEAIAHSDFDRYPTGRTYGTETGFMAVGRRFDIRSETMDLGALRALVTKLLSYCTSALFELNRQLVKLESDTP